MTARSGHECLRSCDQRRDQNGSQTGIKLPQKSQTEMRFLTADEVTDLADTIDDRYRALLLAAAYTGCRFGELAGLKTQCVDLLRRTFTIAEALSEVRGEVRMAPPKTAAARRQVALPKFLADELAAHVADWPPGDDGFVFTAPQGGPLLRRNFRRRTWLPAVRASVGEPLRVHELRHTHAAMLIAQGEHPKVIQNRLGHSSIKVTLDTYGHLFEGLDEAAAERLDAAFTGSRADALRSPGPAKVVERLGAKASPDWEATLMRRRNATST